MRLGRPAAVGFGAGDLAGERVLGQVSWRRNGKLSSKEGLSRDHSGNLVLGCSGAGAARKEHQGFMDVYRWSRGFRMCCLQIPSQLVVLRYQWPNHDVAPSQSRKRKPEKAGFLILPTTAIRS